MLSVGHDESCPYDVALSTVGFYAFCFLDELYSLFAIPFVWRYFVEEYVVVSEVDVEFVDCGWFC